MQAMEIKHVIVSMRLNDCFTNDCKSSPFFITDANSGKSITENK